MLLLIVKSVIPTRLQFVILVYLDTPEMELIIANVLYLIVLSVRLIQLLFVIHAYLDISSTILKFMIGVYVAS